MPTTPSPLTTLPEELLLQILTYLPPSDLWLYARHINPTYRLLASDVALHNHIPRFTIGLNFTLSSSSTHAHRWYDVRGTVHCTFRRISRLNPQYALFETEAESVSPKESRGRVLETWRRMCAAGFGPEQEWRVTFNGTGLLMKMPKLVLAEEGAGVWCDWRELLDGYYARLPAVWEGLARRVV